jgi:hypothetical protein
LIRDPFRDLNPSYGRRGPRGGFGGAGVGRTTVGFTFGTESGAIVGGIVVVLKALSFGLPPELPELAFPEFPLLPGSVPVPGG